MAKFWGLFLIPSWRWEFVLFWQSPDRSPQGQHRPVHPSLQLMMVLLIGTCCTSML